MSQPSVPSTVPQVVPNRIAPLGDYANSNKNYWLPAASGGGFVTNPLTTDLACANYNITGASTITTSGLTTNGNGVFNYPVTFNSTVNFAYPPAGLSPRITLFYNQIVSLPATIPSPNTVILAPVFTPPTTGVYIVNYGLEYETLLTTSGLNDSFAPYIAQTDGLGINVARATIPVVGTGATGSGYAGYPGVTVLETLTGGVSYTPRIFIYNNSGTLATTNIWNFTIRITSLC